MLSVIILNVAIFSVMLSVVMLNVSILSVVMLNVLLSVVKLNVVLVSVVVPSICALMHNLWALTLTNKTDWWKQTIIHKSTAERRIQLPEIKSII